MTNSTPPRSLPPSSTAPSGTPHEHLPSSGDEDDLPEQLGANDWDSNVPPIHPDRFADAGQLSFEAQLPPWVMDVEDFDFNLFGSPIGANLAHLEVTMPDSGVGERNGAAKADASLKDLWFTNLYKSSHSRNASGTATPALHHTTTEVDESYRHTLQHKLMIVPPPVDHTHLPSAEFLNSCFRCYFARFHPVFPIIHAPTFRPSKANSTLLLSICSVGSLFTGSARAIQQGVQIWERLHKSILSNWSKFMERGLEEVISMTQAALIGQTFGLLSGDANHLATVEAFHGTVISWARRCKMFATRHQALSLAGLSDMQIEREWREWTRREEFIRTVLGLLVHDAELAYIFHHEPLLRHQLGEVPVAAPEELFMASNPQDWALKYKAENSILSNSRQLGNSFDSPSLPNLLDVAVGSHMSLCVALEGCLVVILEGRLNQRLDNPEHQRIQDFLLRLNQQYLVGQPLPGTDHLNLKVLWHLAFMSLNADFDLIERAIGREGAVLSPEDQESVTIWANSVQGLRCVIHGALICKHLQTLSLGVEPAVHVPKAMFVAAISWYCCTKYGSAEATQKFYMADDLELPEMDAIGVNAGFTLFESNGFKYGKLQPIEASGPVCALTDLLQRIGHWEIARKFAKILGTLISNTSDAT